MMKEQLNAGSQTQIAILAEGLLNESLHAEGLYGVKCHAVLPQYEKDYFEILDRLKLSKPDTYENRHLEGLLLEFPKELVWEDSFFNTVVTAGKNHLLDNYIAGSAFTQTGPYMGLISSVSYSAIAAADTMASHGGWTEAGSTNAPTFSARVAPSWSAASAGAKATSTAVSFTMTGAGTLKGAFLVLGSGAVTTLMSTAGTLFSAGLFSGGDQVVSNGNVVTVTYSLSI